MEQTARTMLVAAFAALAVALPFAPYLIGEDWAVLYISLAADVQYYARMARSFTEVGRFSFDGVTISNGFMPLWQFITAALDFGHSPSDPPDVLLKSMFIASLALTAFAMGGLAWTVAARVGWVAAIVTLPILVPGAVHWIAAAADTIGLLSAQQFTFNIWSVVNGMESALGLALFAIWLPVASRLLTHGRATPLLAFWAGTLSFLIFMARLDDVFLGIALFLGLLTLSKSTRQSAIRSFVIVPVLGSALYIAGNIYYAGSPLPVSGLSKTAVFSLPTGWWHLSQIGKQATYEARLVPILLAALVGSCVMFWFTMRRKSADPLLLVLGLYLIFKAGFLFTSVPLVHQGFWYYALMIGAVNLILAIAAGRLLVSIAGRPLQWGLMMVAVLATVWSARNAAHYLTDLRPGSYSHVASELCRTESETRRSLVTLLAQYEGSRGIIDTGDGVYAYCLEEYAYTVTGLGDSPATLREMQIEGFAEFAVKRGYDLVVESSVPWASYGWRQLIGDWPMDEAGQIGSLSVWRLLPNGS